jgi:hypothetical protein
MSIINKIILETIETTEFIHLFDIEFPVPSDYTFNDITLFFDYCLFNISKIDHYVMETFGVISREYETNIRLSDIQLANSLMKSLTIPKDKDIEEIYMRLYTRHKNILSNMFHTCCTAGKCMFFIFCPSFPDDVLLAVCYKDKWIDTLKNNISLSDLKELDIIIFLSGYTYIFKSKNIFNNVLNQSLDKNKIYFLYYA